MKKIIIIALLLFSTSAFGQVYFSGTRQPLYDSGADSLITRMETATGKTMTVAGKTMISDMFTMYKDSLSITSLQNFFDVLYFLDIGVETAAKLNWVKNAHNITNVNSVTFDSTGAYGNGSSSYLNTNYKPSTGAVNFTKLNNSFAVYVKTNEYSVSQFYLYINGDGSTWTYLNSNNTDALSMNISIGGDGQASSSHNNYITGLHTSSREDTSTFRLYKNDTLKVSKTSAYAQSIDSKTAWMFRDVYYISNYSTATVSFAYIGKSVDATLQRKIYNISKYWQNNKNSITFFNP